MSTTIRGNLQATGTSAPYGQACIHCAKVKCKCLIRERGQRCERCQRLNKECITSVSVRKANPRKTRDSKTAQLEEKLNGLMSMLESSRAPISSGNHPQNENFNISPPTSQLSAGASPPSHAPTVVLTPPASIYGGVSSTSINDPTSWEPTPLEAEQYLQVFRTSRLPRFPYVYISPRTSATSLKIERPFLWMCIMHLSTTKYEQSTIMGLKIRETLCQRMIMEFDKNIDLLLGLLAFIGWPNLNTKDKPTLSVLTQLAVSVVFDLGLNRHIQNPSDVSQIHNCIKAGGLPASFTRTNEERRAVLGCFVFNSIIAGYLQRIDGLRWTDHMEQCAQVLEKMPECEGDLLLVQQARLQRIAEKVHRGHWFHPNPKKQDQQRPVIPVYIKALEAEYSDVLRQIPPEIVQNQTLQMHVHHINIKIHELALMKDYQSDFRRIENLYACFNAIRSFYDIFWTTTAHDFLCFPFNVSAQIGHALVVLFKLSVLDDPLWDKDYIHNTMDVLATVDRVTESMQQAADLVGRDAGQTHENNYFLKAVKLGGQLRAAWAMKLAMPSTELQVATDVVDPVPDVLGDLANEPWLTDMLAIWER